MGVAAEPGQKGINWSNIAVGELAASPRIYAHANVVIRWYHEHGMFFRRKVYVVPNLNAHSFSTSS